jgi:hypothetical protein
VAIADSEWKIANLAKQFGISTQIDEIQIFELGAK